mmetsp:Transcript_6926/g.7411  ORF Transcript_6926/g.7411 Transcript_6926/m.7411 type:complete len:118 (-) Transcript_6926:410-763(-)
MLIRHCRRRSHICLFFARQLPRLWVEKRGEERNLIIYKVVFIFLSNTSNVFGCEKRERETAEGSKKERKKKQDKIQHDSNDDEDDDERKKHSETEDEDSKTRTVTASCHFMSCHLMT